MALRSGNPNASLNGITEASPMDRIRGINAKITRFIGNDDFKSDLKYCEICI